MKRFLVFLLGLFTIPFFLCMPPSLLSSEMPRDATAAGKGKGVVIPFKEFRLKNGLRVILSEDHTAPTYSICVTYNVGSRDERPGRTGFARLFEHMMFQGSKNVGKGEHFILIQNNGGNMNGTTNADRTNYFQTFSVATSLPSTSNTFSATRLHL